MYILSYDKVLYSHSNFLSNKSGHWSFSIAKHLFDYTNTHSVTAWNYNKNKDSLSFHISMTSYLFSLLTRSSPYVTLIKPSSSLKVTHRSFRHASSHLCYQFPTSLQIPHLNYSSPSQRPSFEHAGLTCITAIIFHHFFTDSELKTYLFRKSYPPP